MEEGIEFEVDIDLLEEAPWFTVKVKDHHQDHRFNKYIVDALEERIITALWKMLSRDLTYGGRVQLLASDLQALGSIFVDTMRWYLSHQHHKVSVLTMTQGIRRR